jgi:hypothetical protein
MARAAVQRRENGPAPVGNRRRRPPRRGLPAYGPIPTRQSKPVRQGLGRKLKAISNSQRSAGVAFLIFAVFSGGVAFGMVDQNQHLGAGALAAQATVVGVHEGSSRSPDSWVTVEFVPAGGRIVRADVTQFSWDPTPRVGDVARVRYDPADPTYYVRDERVGPAVVWPICLAFLAIGLLALGVAGLRRRLPAGFRKRH